MAIDMMVDSAKLDREMLATANALREKGKTEAEIPWEDEIGFEQAVLAIKGGVDLNFEVVGGKTEPTNPVENTIWINTDVDVAGWSFSPTEPTNPASGMVWFQTDNSSRMFFNALTEDEIWIYPLLAKQYTGGSFRITPARIYQEGKWNNLVLGIIEDGVALVDFSGNLRATSEMVVTKENGYLKVSITNSTSAGPATTAKVDITNVDTLYLDVDVKNIAKDGISFGLFSNLNASSSSNVLNNVVTQDVTTITGRQMLVCDVKQYSGAYYIGMFSNDVNESNAYTREYHIYNLYGT